MTAAPLRVGFVGLGRMGGHMARRLVDSGFDVCVWNRTLSRCDPLAATGAGVAPSLRSLAAGADVVVTMVADADALAAVLHGDDGLLAGLTRDSLLVDMSTIGQEAALRFAAEVAARGARWIDAPVSGSTALAAQGALTTMVGADSETLERVRPVLAAMATKIFHVGPPGTGALMKLAVNSVVAVVNEAVAEGLVLAERGGIACETAYDVLCGSVASSPYVLYKRDAFLSPEETPVAFTVQLLRKDLRLVLGQADSLGVPLAAVAACDAVLEQAEAHGLGGADMARVADVVRAT